MFTEVFDLSRLQALSKNDNARIRAADEQRRIPQQLLDPLSSPTTASIRSQANFNTSMNLLSSSFEHLIYEDQGSVIEGEDADDAIEEQSTLEQTVLPRKELSNKEDTKIGGLEGLN